MKLLIVAEVTFKGYPRSSAPCGSWALLF